MISDIVASAFFWVSLPLPSASAERMVSGRLSKGDAHLCLGWVVCLRSHPARQFCVAAFTDMTEGRDAGADHGVSRRDSRENQISPGRGIRLCHPA